MKTIKIEKACLSIEQFKECYLKNSYNENILNSDGSINKNYNSKKKTGLIAQIIEDGWNKMPVDEKNIILNYRKNADIEIKKVIDCHNKNLGCSVYECPECHECVFIGHTCKSRFCTSCGYKYKLDRVNNILNTAYNCKHRQVVFTCAKELWPYFLLDFNLINIFYDAVNSTIYSILNESYKTVNGITKCYTSKTKYYPGYFAFLHTFGRDIKWNPHMHTLIAEIKLSNNSYKKWEYFDFKALSIRFMKILLDLMDNYLNDYSFKLLKNKLHKKYKNGFYVYAEKKVFPNLKAGIEYITRYCSRPAISENRILNYDGTNVTFFYNDHKDNSYHEVTVSNIKFVKMLLKHLLPSNFKSIRYYGFYRKKLPIHDKMVMMIPFEKRNFNKSLLNYRVCLFRFFNVDPFCCPKCNIKMDYLCEIT